MDEHPEVPEAGASILVGTAGVGFQIGLEIHAQLEPDDGVFLQMPDGVILHNGRPGA
jgi:hypothetical protein